MTQDTNRIECVLANLAQIPDPSWADVSDSYKISHRALYPTATTWMQSHFESRGGVFKKVVPFGLQGAIIKYFLNSPVTQDEITYLAESFGLHFGRPDIFSEDLFKIIVNEYDGRAPVRVRAIPEGTVVGQKVPLQLVDTNDERMIAFVNYVETLLVQNWYPTTVASQSRFMKEQILRRLDKSGDVGEIMFKLHDFGCRGVTCPEQAAIGGAAHLINFLGTDTVPALRYLHRYYGERMAGHSIVATEHSVMTLLGRDGEMDQVQKVLDQNPTGLVAIVGDTYNIYKFCDTMGTRFKEQILGRDGTLVIRPDSGDPHEVIPDMLTILTAPDRFGFETNEKGFNVLPPQVRLIQGDGIDVNSMDDILETLEQKKWSASNIAFGSGGGLLMKMNRDTNKFAFKANASTIDGKDIEVYKDPITDPGKTSKRGFLKVVKVDGEFQTLQGNEARESELPDAMHTVYDHGKLLVFDDFATIRARAAITDSEL